jgi:phasin family protein
MSSYNRPSPTPVGPKQTTVDDRRAIMDTALRIAAIMTEANERLFRLQSEAVNAAFADNSKHIKALLNTTESPAALMQWPSLYQENAQKMVDVTRSWFEIASQTQAELGKLLGEPFASYNVEAQKYLDQFTNAITDGRDAAAAQVKDFLAKAVGSASEAQPAKKEKVA